MTIIPATVRGVEAGGQIRKAHADLRVAAYCRVSTGDESQQTSYTTQKRYYTGYIEGHEGWTLAGIYADEAISGTSRAHREQFNKMMEDAKAGRIDYIVTKSISRFARNTVDTLKCVRELKSLSPAVGCFFEKENIDTLDTTGELILTILSALAQDESRSISDNIRWSIQKKFESGDPMIDLNRMMGYDKGENGEWVINEEQAKIVRYIFDQYTSGVSATQIAVDLNEKGITTVLGNQWRADAILTILRNEKYVGDLTMQKTVTQDFLTHKKLRNNGLAPQVHITDHHVPIISREQFDAVQQGFSARKARREAKKQKGGKPKNSIWGMTYLDADGEKQLLERTTYTTPAAGYTDERSMAAEGIVDDHLSEHYFFNYAVWKTANGVKFPDIGRAALLEIAIQQSFMEMMYRLKREYEAEGDDCSLCRAFSELKKHLSTVRSSGGQKLDLLDQQIEKAEESLVNTKNKLLHCDDDLKDVYADLVRDIEQRLVTMRQEREELAPLDEMERMAKAFQSFLDMLKALPNENDAGMPIKVNGVDVDGSLYCHADGTPIEGRASAINHGKYRITPERIAEAPDLLTFSVPLYDICVRASHAKGDTIEYETTFGLRFETKGNSRMLHNFYGYRRCGTDGKVEILDANWKVNNKTICYNRSEVKWKRDDLKKS